MESREGGSRDGPIHHGRGVATLRARQIDAGQFGGGKGGLSAARISLRALRHLGTAVRELPDRCLSRRDNVDEPPRNGRLEAGSRRPRRDDTAHARGVFELAMEPRYRSQSLLYLAKPDG